MPSSATMQHLHSARPTIRTCLNAARRAKRIVLTVVYSSATTNITSPTTKRTYYQLLGVPESASPTDIRTSFRRLAKTLHPDHNKLPGAMDKFKEVKLAYDVLVDACARAEYDRELKVQALAEAQSAAQAAAGGKRASTLGLRRNKAAASARANAASPRRVSGDDFEQFAAAGNPLIKGPADGTGSHGVDGASYTSIFSNATRSISSRMRAGARSGPSYRSIFDTRPRSASPPKQQPVIQPLSGNAGGGRAETSSSGYAANIFNGPGIPTSRPHSTSTPGSSSPQPGSTSGGSTNPCIFKGRSISPNLGVLPQQRQPAGTTVPNGPGWPSKPDPASIPGAATNTRVASTLSSTALANSLLGTGAPATSVSHTAHTPAQQLQNPQQNLLQPRGPPPPIQAHEATSPLTVSVSQAAERSGYSISELQTTQKSFQLQGPELGAKGRSPLPNKPEIATTPVTLQTEAQTVHATQGATAKVTAAIMAAAKAKRDAALAESMAVAAAAVAAAAKDAALAAEAFLHAMLEGAVNGLPSRSETLGGEVELEQLILRTSLPNDAGERSGLAQTSLERPGNAEKEDGDAHADEVDCVGPADAMRVKMTPLEVALKPMAK